MTDEAAREALVKAAVDAFGKARPEGDQGQRHRPGAIRTDALATVLTPEIEKAAARAKKIAQETGN